MSEAREVLPIFAVLRTIRDARSTRSAERQLLYALGMRCNPKKKYLSWPSYRLLALDTQLDEVTLKRAAKRLEEKGLIKRVVRRNRSNCFYLNIALLQEQAATVKFADAAARHETEEDASPFEAPKVDQYHTGTDVEQGEDDWLSGAAR